MEGEPSLRRNRWIQIQHISCMDITISVNFRYATKKPMSVRLCFMDHTTKREITCWHKVKKSTTCSDPVSYSLKPGHHYTLQLCSGNGKLQHSINFKAELNNDELLQLMAKAIMHVYSSTKGRSTRMQLPRQQIKYFYRNKPPSYWQGISANRRGIMWPYIKDNNGDPASNINNSIDGLFFSAQGQKSNGMPPSSSLFGTKRYLVPVHIWMHNPAIRLYLADFYCIYKTHYVTIVMTKAGSLTDQFCMKKLVSLNKSYNPFLTLGQDGCVYVADNDKVWVEVLFTEPVDIQSSLINFGCFFQNVISKGTSKPGGLPKNKSCTVCNLYPQK